MTPVCRNQPTGAMPDVIEIKAPGKLLLKGNATADFSDLTAANGRKNQPRLWRPALWHGPAAC
jgi:hypothetical protein